MAKEEKRYLWKTVELPPKKSNKDAISHWDRKQVGNKWRIRSGCGWFLGVARKTKRAILCREGFHGNLNPQHAIRWHYGDGLALIEVGGDRARGSGWGNVYAHQKYKECYSEATLVGLWKVRDVKKRSRTQVEAAIRAATPIVGELPKDFEWTKYNKHKET